MTKTIKASKLDESFMNQIMGMIYDSEHGFIYNLDADFEYIKGFMWGLQHAGFFTDDEFGILLESVDSTYIRLRVIARENTCNKI